MMKKLGSLVAGFALTTAPALHAAEDLDLFGGDGFTVEILHNDLTPSTLDGTNFGSTNVTGGSVTKSFQIRNNGNENLLILSHSNSSSGQFTLTGLPLPTNPIPPGGTDVFAITFNPTDEGQWNANIGLLSTDPNHNPFIFRVTGFGVGFPEIVVEGQFITPGSSFGNIVDGSTTPQPSNGTLFVNTDVGATSTQNFRIRNIGDATLTVSIIDNSGHFSQTGWGTSVPPGGTDDFLVNFTPTSYGPKTATITITNNDANENPFTFEVLGAGVAPDILVQGGVGQNVSIADGDTTPAGGDGTDFGNVDLTGGSKTNIFAIRNEAAANKNLVVTSATLSGPGASHFSVMAAPNSSNPIAPGNSANLLINFDPTSTGVKTATVNILSTDPDESPYTFTITGTPVAQPEINVQGARGGLPYVNIPDGSTATGGTNGTSYVDTNVGGTTTNLFKIQNSGDDKLTYSATSSNPRFNILAMGESIEAGAADDFFQIAFTPTTAGVQTATITITSNDANENPYTFVLQGTGVAPDIALLGGSGFAVPIASGDTTPIFADGTDFGSQHILGETKISTFAIRNTGNTSLTVTSVTLSGGGASHFTVTGAPGSGNPIVAGGTFPFAITFDPFSTGVKNATVTILSTDPDENPYTFAITGTGVNGPNIDVTGSQNSASLPFIAIANGSAIPVATNGTAFEDTNVGSSEINQLRLLNAGNLDLTYTITSSNPEFAVSQVNSPLPAGDTNIVLLTFTPTSGGTKTSLITINNNDADENPYTFTVSGLARTPEIDVRGGSANPPVQIILDGDTTPTAIDGTLYGSVNATGGLEQHQFRIINQGNAPLTILSGSMSDGTHFQIVGLPSAPSNQIPPGASLTFAVNFNPAWDGELTDTVRLINTDTDEAIFEFDVRGTGLGSPEIEITPAQNDETIPNGSTITFNTTEVGDINIKYLDLSNLGDGMLDIHSMSLSGDVPHIRWNGATPNTPFNLSPAQELNLNLIFDPLTRGTKTVTLTIQNNDSNEEPFVLILQGTAIDRDVEVLGGANLDQTIVSGDTTPSTVDRTDFGNLEIAGQSLTRTFRLRNEGELQLQYINATLGGDTGDFSIGNLPAPASFLVPAPLGNHDFTITFNPTSSGLKTAKINITTDDPNEGTYTFEVSGNGTTVIPEPDLNIFGGPGFTSPIASGNHSPGTVAGTDFGTAIEGGAPVSRQFQLRNGGSAELLGIAGASGNPDATVTSVATSLAPGATDTFTVTFNPVTPGTQTAVIGIVSNDPNESPYLFTVRLEVEPAEVTPPTIESFALDGTSGTVEFKGATGRTYILKTSTTLLNDWIQVPGTSPVVANGSVQSISFTIDPTDGPKRFYRLEEAP
jgi:hypothetical protein